MKLSDELEAELARVVWVEPFGMNERYELVRTNSTESGLKTPHTREAHAECEALREQVREIVRRAVSEAVERCAKIAELREGDAVARGIAAEIRARGGKL